MLTTIESIVERLVAGYAPDRIILYGSHATGQARHGSDIDLLIVKETRERPIDRRVAVERLLADRGVPIDVTVYTAGELRRLFAAGSPFIEEVMEHGRVLYMRKATAAWLHEAQDELESAVVLLDHERLLPHGEPGEEDARRAVSAAERLMARARDVLRGPSAPS